MGSKEKKVKKFDDFLKELFKRNGGYLNTGYDEYIGMVDTPISQVGVKINYRCGLDGDVILVGAFDFENGTELETPKEVMYFILGILDTFVDSREYLVIWPNWKENRYDMELQFENI